MSNTTPPAHNRAKISTINYRIAHTLKHLRQLKNLTQQNMATLIGCSPQQYQKYENNTNRISTAQLVLLAEHLNVPLRTFYEETPPSPQSTQDFAQLLTHLTPTKRRILFTLAQELAAL